MQGFPRHVLRRDVPKVADTLARAFAADPVMTWLLAGAPSPADDLRRWMQVQVEDGLRCGHTYATDGTEAAAVWAPPDVKIFDATSGQRLVETLADIVGRDVAERRMGTMGDVMTPHPDDPHFYLLLLGARPEQQGRGLAGGLIDPILGICDAQGLGAYLESSNPRNLTFYRRHGFEVTHEIQIPDGPVMYPMWREPRRG